MQNRWPGSPIPVWMHINCVSCWDIMVLLIEHYNIILIRVGLCFNSHLQNTYQVHSLIFLSCHGDNRMPRTVCLLFVSTYC